MKKFPPRAIGPTEIMIMARAAYVHLETPWSNNDDDKKKYQLVAIIDNEDKATLEAVNTAVENAVKEGTSKKWGGKRPFELRLPLQDGRKKEGQDGFDNSMYLSVKSGTQIKPVGLNNQIIPFDEVYSGCYVILRINFYPFEMGSKGVACGLNGVMKFADGERLGGGGDGSGAFSGMDMTQYADTDSFGGLDDM